MPKKCPSNMVNAISREAYEASIMVSAISTMLYGASRKVYGASKVAYGL